MPQTVLHPLAPLITAESHTLILGTMPSPRSRAEVDKYGMEANDKTITEALAALEPKP